MESGDCRFLLHDVPFWRIIDEKHLICLGLINIANAP